MVSIVIPIYHPPLRPLLTRLRRPLPQIITTTIRATFLPHPLSIDQQIRTTHCRNVVEIWLCLRLHLSVAPTSALHEIPLYHPPVTAQFFDDPIHENDSMIASIFNKYNAARDHHRRAIRCVVNPWKRHTGNDRNHVIVDTIPTVNSDCFGLARTSAD